MLVEWDFKDQLHKVDLGGGGNAYYVYGASGERVRKVIEQQNGGRKEERIYLGGFEIYREYHGGINTVTLERETLHIMDDQQRIAMAETKTIEDSNPVNIPTPVQRYQLGNHLGSAILELGKDGALISYEEYHPYGTTAFQTMNGATEVSSKRYRYTGKERDEETGLYYHGARYYACWLGRWSSPDPAGLRDSLSLYSYGSQNPLTYIDLTGHQGRAWPKAGESEARGAQTGDIQLLHATSELAGGEGVNFDALERQLREERRQEQAAKWRSRQPTAKEVAGLARKPDEIYAATQEDIRSTQEFKAEVRAFNEHPTDVKELWPDAYRYALLERDYREAEALRREASASGLSVRDLEAGKKAAQVGAIGMMALPAVGELAGIGEAGAVGPIAEAEIATDEASGVTTALNRAESATLKIESLPEDVGYTRHMTSQTGERVVVGRNVVEGFQYGTGKDAVTMIEHEGEAFFQSHKGTSGKEVGAWYRFYGIKSDTGWVGKQLIPSKMPGGIGPNDPHLYINPALAGTEVLGPVQNLNAAEANQWLESRGVQLFYK
jgi:RHS repeat-associated protein